MKKTLLLIRPQQWIKNGFVLIPMFFGGRLMNVDDAIASVVTFFAFSFVASAIYCFNDIIDVEADLRHPVKCHRPIASRANGLRADGYLDVVVGLTAVLPSPTGRRNGRYCGLLFLA